MQTKTRSATKVGKSTLFRDCTLIAQVMFSLSFFVLLLLPHCGANCELFSCALRSKELVQYCLAISIEILEQRDKSCRLYCLAVVI